MKPFMIHYIFFALVLTLALPIPAYAFQEKTVHLKGVSVTAVRSATRLCGVDFVITVSDGDQHLVKIDFSYNGTFKDAASFSAPINPSYSTRSNKINISVGRLTEPGNLARVQAIEWPENTLVCHHPWTYHFVASEYNATQDGRDAIAEQKRKEQARIDEKNRKKSEQAENKRRMEEAIRRGQQSQEEYRRERAEEYNRRPENAGCIGVSSNSEADLNEGIARCERGKAVAKENRDREEAADRAARLKREAEERRQAEHAARQREFDAERQRSVADPCAYADEQERLLPEKLRQYQAQRIQGIQGQIENSNRWLATALALCPAFRNQPPTADALQQQARSCHHTEKQIRAVQESIKKMEAEIKNPPPMQNTQMAAWVAALRAQCRTSRPQANSAVPQTQTLAPQYQAAPAPQYQAAPMPAPQYQAAPVQPQSYQPPAAPTAQTVDPCENLRMAYVNDRKNIALAYQLRRCVKKNRQAVQVQ